MNTRSALTSVGALILLIILVAVVYLWMQPGVPNTGVDEVATSTMVPITSVSTTSVDTLNNSSSLIEPTPDDHSE